jgi:mono/diheme cytochrome c family protein
VRRFRWVIALAVITPAGLLLANIAEPTGPIVGWDRVGPVLAEGCASCHDADLMLGGVDISSYGATLAGENPPAVPYDMTSPLVRVLTEAPRSGMRGPDHTVLLSEEEKALVFDWIRDGCYEVGWGYAD